MAARLSRCSAAHSTAAVKFRHAALGDNTHAVPYRRLGKRLGGGFGVLRSAGRRGHNPYDLEPEPESGTRTVKAIIPAGAPIDIESCGDTWCYMAWAGHVGYVKHQYLVHHVTVEVASLVHVTHVHKLGLINF